MKFNAALGIYTPPEFAPSRGRELKCTGQPVPPHPGVRPLAGAGIEIVHHRSHPGNRGRFAPSRGRELKLSTTVRTPETVAVRPLAGAGIEIT